MPKRKEKFVIIDAMALAYRAYFAFISRPLSNSAGEPTSAVFGFINQLFKIIEDTQPDYLVVAFDSKEKTFRHELYDKYKSSRAQMPEDMIPQIQRIKDVIHAFNIPLLIAPGFEADDLIGTAVHQAEKKGLLSYAVTPDKDYIQLITENVKVVKPGKSTEDIVLLDRQKVIDDMGFEPIQMIDYLALIGDSSDDIPGVAGIGPKTATPLLQEFHTLEGIYENIEKISKAGVKKKLEESKENAFLSKKLATIITDCPFEVHFEDSRFTDPNFEVLLEIFNELDFKMFGTKLLKLFNKKNKDIEEVTDKEELNLDSNNIFDSKKVEYKLIVSPMEAKKLAKELSETDLFVFDTETDSLDVLDLNLAGVAFSYKKHSAYFVAVNPKNRSESLFEKDLSDRLALEDFIKIFKPVFENEKIKKVCQNGKYDIAVMRTFGINVNGFYFDTMLASYILDPDQKHGMDSLSKQYLNYEPIPISSLIGDKKDAAKIFEADLHELCNYSSEDADVTFQLYEKLEKEITRLELDKIAFDVDFPLVYVLEDMERTGINIDVDVLHSLSNEMQQKLTINTKMIYKLADEEFNINSTKQLQQILFEKLNLTATKKTKTGYSTDAQSLEGLRGQNEIIDLLLEYRQLSKLKSTYTDALPKLIHHTTGRLHSSFNQTVASTGRLSSLNPNLQNIPIRTEMGKEIRKAFVPRDDKYLILSADYSQIELRIMASLCEDPGLISAFSNGEDIHRSTAAHVFKVNPNDVTPDMRRKAKEVNFGILYGIGAFGLKTRLGITQTHAKEIIDTYFNTFKNVKDFMENSVKQAKEKGYAETLLGRRRYLKNINSSNRVVRQFEERVAINMPIQGTAADMIKLAMINIYNTLIEKKSKTKMLLQVHDELVFDLYKEESDEILPLVKKLMEESLPLKVPIVVEAGSGNNWLEAH